MSNIWTWLGLPEDHREPKKISALVKNHEEINWDSKTTGEPLPCLVQEKLDGVHGILVANGGKYALFSRTGKFLTNVDGLLNTVRIRLLDQPMINCVRLCEICNDDYSLEQISGTINPNRKEPADPDIVAGLYLGFFDAFTLTEFIKGYTEVTFPTRMGRITHDLANGFPAITPARLVCYDEDDVASFKGCVLDAGGEGIVRKSLTEPWYAGKKYWAYTKEVRGVSYDLECIGYEEGTGKYKGKVANLLFRWKDGETIKCMLGKGWTHDDAEAMFQQIGASDLGESSPIGNIFEVYALQESSKGKLRLPKVGEQRHDKTEADF
jgi:ATP-dependent DNA ligase